MPNNYGRRCWKHGLTAMTPAQVLRGFSRTGSITKARIIDTMNSRPGGFGGHVSPESRNNRNMGATPSITYPEDSLYPALYKRLPSLQYEAGARVANLRSIGVRTKQQHIDYNPMGIGDSGRPLLAQRIVRRQHLYIEEYGMSNNAAWLHARSDFNTDLEAFKRTLNRVDIKEEVAAALTAETSSLRRAHRVWVEGITARLTGFNPTSVHFKSVQKDGLPTLRELMMKSMPFDDAAVTATKFNQMLLGDAFRFLQDPELGQDFTIKFPLQADINARRAAEKAAKAKAEEDQAIAQQVANMSMA